MQDSNHVYQSSGSQYIYNRSAAPAPAAPCNDLPRDTPAFIGRKRELRALVHNVVQSAEAQRIIPVYAIDGMPGVGKSAFAVHAAHMLQDRFPDGQFYINLHAYTPGHRPKHPADALFELLTADGVQVADVPATLDARAGLWRKRMARSRSLVVLDNALSRKQVQSLLPGASHCLVMVTSRQRLAGLLAEQAPVNLALGTLPPEDAAALFGRMANRHLGPAEKRLVDDLTRLCGYLPLAICLLASPLAPEPQWPISDLVRDLVQTKHHLSRMGAEDVTVEAAFDLSYRQLSVNLRRFFRRLGLHPGPDLDLYAAAALNATTPDHARQCLDLLYGHHLLDQPAFGRYRLHDLVRQYAVMRAESDAPADRGEATGRLMDYYRHAAEAASRLLSRPTGRPSAAPKGGPHRLPPIHSRSAAMSWMRVEQANLFACSSTAPAHPADAVLPALATAMAPYLGLAGPWDRAISLHRAAAATAGASGNRRAQADALRELGVLHRHTGRYADAESALGQALRLYRSGGLKRGVADVLTQLGAVRRQSGDAERAAADLRAALDIYEELGMRHGRADALNEMGTVLWTSGRYAEALAVQLETLTVYEGLRDPQGTANTLRQIGGLQQLTVGYPPAIEMHRRSLGLYRELGDRLGEARALNYLGAAYCHIGEYEDSRDALSQALAIHVELGYRPGQANALNYLGIVHCRTGAYPDARRLLTEALAIYQDLGSRTGHADVLNQLGVLDRLTGDTRTSADRHERALAVFEDLSDVLGQAEALVNLGDLALVLDRVGVALGYYRRALELAERAQLPHPEANALFGAARCGARADGPGSASGLFRRAQAVYHRIGVPYGPKAAADLPGDCPR